MTQPSPVQNTPVDARALFGISMLFSVVAWSIVAVLILWPALGTVSARTALVFLIAPHLFRYIGLGFLVPGVTKERLPERFAQPAAWGDLLTAVLAIVAIVAVASRAPGAAALVWTFNVVGAADLLYALTMGQITLRTAGPGSLGTAFYIPTVIVPGLLASHVMLFMLLTR